jgi:NhaA family Na+:H+ antiporter
MLGLFVGKQAGVFAAIRIGDALGICCRPAGASWAQIYGASVLCGIGFTMSFFIGAIAAPDDPQFVDAARIGTLVGTALAALTGWAVLRASSPVPWIDNDVRASLRLFAFNDTDDRAERKTLNDSGSV